MYDKQVIILLLGQSARCWIAFLRLRSIKIYEIRINSRRNWFLLPLVPSLSPSPPLSFTIFPHTFSREWESLSSENKFFIKMHCTCKLIRATSLKLARNRLNIARIEGGRIQNLQRQWHSIIIIMVGVVFSNRTCKWIETQQIGCSMFAKCNMVISCARAAYSWARFPFVVCACVRFFSLLVLEY